MLVNNEQSQRGVTLVELMVGLTVGMIVVGGVISVYLSTIKSSNVTLKASRLNQEMSAAMNIMANDIRRAGYWGNSDFTKPAENPFSYNDTTIPENTALRVFSNGGSGTSYSDVTGHATIANRIGSCITYAYDANNSGAPAAAVTGVQSAEKFGFRWDGTAADPIYMRRSATTTNSCTDGDWTSNPVTETDSIIVTGLSFDLSASECINTSEPNAKDDDGDGVVDNDTTGPAGTPDGKPDDMNEINCYVTAPGDSDAAIDETIVEVRRVKITLQAQLKSDASVKAKMEQTVKVRNNLIRVVP